MPRLYILSGPDLGRSVEVGEGATLGRAVECTVHLRDPSVSRFHARLEQDAAGWRVVDTGSRNGVTVRGERAQAVPLADGDELLVGEILLRFRLEASSSPPARAPAPGPSARSIADDEITLEEDPIEEIPARRPSPPERNLAPSLARTTVAAPRPPLGEPRGSRILQYRRIPDRGGFFASDLAQQPWWLKLGAALIAIAVFAAIFLFAFRGTSLLKSRASGGEASEEASKGDGG